MPANPTRGAVLQALTWRGWSVRDPRGRRIGRLVGVVVDRQDGSLRWLLLEARRNVHIGIPPGGIVAGGGALVIPHSADVALSGPVVPADGSFTARLEGQLCELFGVPPTRGARLSAWERRRTTALADVRDGRMTWEPGPRHDNDRRVADTGPRKGPERRNLPGPAKVLVASADDDLLAVLAGGITSSPALTLECMTRDGRAAAESLERGGIDVAVIDSWMQGFPPAWIAGAPARGGHDTSILFLERAGRGRSALGDLPPGRSMVVPREAGAFHVLAAAEQISGAEAA